MGAEVTLRCDVSTVLQVDRPVVITHDAVMTTGEGDTMEAASHMAVNEMARLLMYKLDIDPIDAAMLVSAAVDARFSYVGGSVPRQSRGFPRLIEVVADWSRGLSAGGIMPHAERPGGINLGGSHPRLPTGKPAAIGPKSPPHRAASLDNPQTLRYIYALCMPRPSRIFSL
jgi:hypothetical protein